MGSNKKFSQEWSSATDIGREFGISAIAVNKQLCEAGLRNAAEKSLTARAIDEGWAKPTPLKDGTPHFMWNRPKVLGLLSQKRPRLSHAEVALEGFLRDILKLEEEAEETGIDKLLYFYIDAEVPGVRKLQPCAGSVRRVCDRLGIAARIEEIEALLAGKED